MCTMRSHARTHTRVVAAGKARGGTVGCWPAASGPPRGVVAAVVPPVSPSPHTEGRRTSTAGARAATILGSFVGEAAVAGLATTAALFVASAAPRIRSACSNAPAQEHGDVEVTMLLVADAARL